MMDRSEVERIATEVSKKLADGAVSQFASANPGC
jgi:hypothetical protein